MIDKHGIQLKLSDLFDDLHALVMKDDVNKCIEEVEYFLVELKEWKLQKLMEDKK